VVFRRLWQRRAGGRFSGLGYWFRGVALAFALTVLTMAYAIGHISGCHLNPAVSAGLAPPSDSGLRIAGIHIIAQVLGASRLGHSLPDCQRQGRFQLAGGFAYQRYAAHSPGGSALGRLSSSREVV